MGLCLPFSKTKRYLTGIDWIVNMFDHMLKSSSGVGNASQIILELDGVLPEHRFRELFSRFAALLPVLQGCVARDYNLAPYWKIPRSIDPEGITIQLERFPDSHVRETILSSLASRVNIPFRHDRHHVSFDLAYRGESATFLVMRFDHRLFDARGAEGFLDLFSTYVKHDCDPRVLEGISFIEPAHLSNWRSKFLAGQQANRALLSLARTSHRLFDFRNLKDRISQFRFIQFTEAEARAITDAAYSEAGYLMLMPYLLAHGIQALHRAFLKKGINIPDYVIPISLDMRRPGTLKEKLFFNHVSFLFLSIRTSDIGDRKLLIQSIRGQMYDQAKSRWRENFSEASMLLRIAPLGLLSRVARLPLKGEFGSLAFSQITETAYSSADFLGNRVLDLVHSPRVPVPPGFGFFFNSFAGRLNAIFCFVPELLDQGDVEMVMNSIKDLPAQAKKPVND